MRANDHDFGGRWARRVARWSKSVAEGKGTGAHTAIAFAPVRAQFVRITQTETVEAGPNWAMSNLRLSEAGPGK